MRSALMLGVLFFLVHANGAVHAVVKQQDNGFGAMLNRRGEFLTIH